MLTNEQRSAIARKAVSSRKGKDEIKIIQKDNHDSTKKLDLRRAFLNDFPKDQPLSVCDCFSGENEVIWTQLRKDFNVGKYLALDIKEKRGRIAMDSLDYLKLQKFDHDVIDLDSYGSPWEHWFEVLKRVRTCVVFLTIGQVRLNIQPKILLRKIGINFKIPASFFWPISQTCIAAGLAESLKNYRVEKCLEAQNPGGYCRYFGIKLVCVGGENLAKSDRVEKPAFSLVPPAPARMTNTGATDQKSAAAMKE